MKSIRIQPVGPATFQIDVVCDCGANALANEKTGERSLRHEVVLGDVPEETHAILFCERCGKRYRLHPQWSHFHVSDEPTTDGKE